MECACYHKITASEDRATPRTKNQEQTSKMKQRVLITGGAGFIGSNLVRYMLLNGHQVLNVDCLTYAGNLSSLKDLERQPSYAFARVDIRDSSAIQKALLDFAPDAVMHLAAESHVDRSIDGPRQFVETNVLGTFNLLQASLKYYRSKSTLSGSLFRFLHVSTDEVYGSLGATGLFTEQSRYAPHSPYAATKAASDHLARAWHDTYGLPVIVSNCSNNYGPYQFPEKLIPVVIMKCLREESIPIYGNGENIRDWLYVEDHCEALSLILKKGTPGETYNVGGTNEKRNIDLVRSICDILDEIKPRITGKRYSEQITFVPDRPGHDQRYAIDATKVFKELGWKPKQDHDSGIRKTVKWYLENQAWWQT